MQLHTAFEVFPVIGDERFPDCWPLVMKEFRIVGQILPKTTLSVSAPSWKNGIMCILNSTEKNHSLHKFYCKKYPIMFLPVGAQ